MLLGQAIPTGTVAPSSINGYPRQLDRFPTHDAARARLALGEAGWPNGFQLKLDCPRESNVPSVAICRAVVAQLGQIGLTVEVVERTEAAHLDLIRRDPPGSDFYLLGTNVPSFDSEQLLQQLFLSRGNQVGRLNGTRFANAEVDRLIQGLSGQVDFTARTQAIAQIWRIVQEETIYVPLHIQTVAYAMKADISIAVDIENQPKLKFARIKTMQ